MISGVCHLVAAVYREGNGSQKRLEFSYQVRRKGEVKQYRQEEDNTMVH